MQEIIIEKKDVEKRIDNFLVKKFNGLSKTLIFKLLRKGKIKVNKEKVNNNYRLKSNDLISIDFDINNKENYFDVKKINHKLEIIYEDENICLINKPIGILSQDDKNEHLLTIQNIFLKYLIDKKEYVESTKNNFQPSICNRLDRNTSGIIIAAKNTNSLKEINQLIKEHKIDKYYLAMVWNQPNKKHELLEAYHFKNNMTNLVYISDVPKKGYKKILTEYWLIESRKKYSILEIKLITGKTHQIRAHLNHINLPIVGDQKYKTKFDNIDKRVKNQALISYKIKFNIDNNSHLSYLNNKVFSIKNIWFKKYFC